MLSPDRPIIPIIALSALLILSWYQTAVAPIYPFSPPPAAPQTTTIIAVGDILLGRHIGEAIDKVDNPNLPFENTRELLADADITFGNLECPLSDSNIPIREGIMFRCLTKYVPGLSSAGFDVLSTANNHAFDQGAKQIGFTRDFLISRNISPVGTGRNQEEAWTPAIITPPNLPHQGGGTSFSYFPPLVGGIEGGGPKFAFLAASYASHNDGGKSRNDFVARIEDLDILKSKIFNLKSQNYFVVVSMHAGTEYTRHPNQEQIDFAHAAIDAGADVVIGHHPHWIQAIEVYSPSIPLSPDEGRVPDANASGREVRKGLIFYSLGNFVFDQSWSQETREGLAVKLNIKNQKLKSAELIPVIIENNCCPRIADETEKAEILKKINLSSEIIELYSNSPN